MDPLLLIALIVGIPMSIAWLYSRLIQEPAAKKQEERLQAKEKNNREARENYE